jgi:hypothetical protein
MPSNTLLLAARVVPRVIATLQAGMVAACANVTADVASEVGESSVTLTAPDNANYYNHPKAEVAGAVSHIEVFEGAFEMANPYTDAACGRLTYEMPLTVRFTLFNRDGSNANAMMMRMRLAGAAMVRVLLDAYTLQPATDDALKVSVPVGYTPYWEFAGEDVQKVFKVQATVAVLVSCEEING